VPAGCMRLGVAPGIHAFSLVDAKRQLDEGCRFVAIGSDIQFLTDAAADTIAELGQRL